MLDGVITCLLVAIVRTRIVFLTLIAKPYAELHWENITPVMCMHTQPNEQGRHGYSM